MLHGRGVQFACGIVVGQEWSLLHFLPQRGKTVPEGLANAEDIRSYRQLASHTVRTLFHVMTGDGAVVYELDI